MRLMLLAVVGTVVACVTFQPGSMAGAIRPLTGPSGGSCTAWAVGPSKWITAAHCSGHVTTLDGVTVEWLAVDTDADIALISGPRSYHTFRVSNSEPLLGDEVQIYGYGMARPTLLMLPGVYIAPNSDFFEASRGMLVSANGMPGMSGGPILWRGRVVSVVTGGGTPTSPAHALGTGVPWLALQSFVVRTKADTH